MSSVTTTSNQNPSEDREADLVKATANLDKVINEFNALVKKPDSLAPAEENLWHSWRFLQVYSIFGLRLPHTENTLKLTLRISDPGEFSFFGGMKEGYNEIYEACDEFVSNIFPQVISIGTSLLDFASDASIGGGDLFSVLIELIDANDTDGALELIGDLQETTKANEKKAGEVKELLGSYKGKLTSAKAKVDLTKESVAADERTSQARLNTIGGDAKTAGSIENLTKKLESKKAEYDEYVKISATTVIYFQLVFPFGLIAAAAVAATYGTKAAEALREMERLSTELEKTNKELFTLMRINQVQDSAIHSLSSAQRYTDLAITHTTTVQNAWGTLSGNLSYVADKVAKMTTGDEQTILQGKAIVKQYAKLSGEKWALLIPPLRELTRNPYIEVEEGEKSLGDLATAVEKEIAKQAA